MNTIKAQLFKSFMDKEKRDLFVSQNIGTIISAQLFSIREKKDWTQGELAQKVNMAQARISVLENPNYQNFSIKTLKRLASAFDVGLMVRFVSFGELAEWVSSLSPEDLAVPDFEHESQLQETEVVTTAQALTKPSDTGGETFKFYKFYKRPTVRRGDTGVEKAPLSEVLVESSANTMLEA
jgi:transcriptional regulator with XRE-family HTH domain